MGSPSNLFVLLQAAFHRNGSNSSMPYASFDGSIHVATWVKWLFLWGKYPKREHSKYSFGDTSAGWTTTCMQTRVLTQASGLFTENRAKVAATLAEQLSRNRHVGQLRTVSAFELKGMIDRILDHYAKWNAGGDEYELAACLDFLENICFGVSIPLAEAAYALYVLRDGIIGILSSGAEDEKGETILQVNRFFDALVLDLLRRY